jgi:ribosomal protein S18 acetylase RimI-like enzyme
MSITVREAKCGDEHCIIELIAELAQTTSALAPSGSAGAGASVSETSPITVGYIVEYLAFPGSHILLAEKDGRVAGLLCYSTRPDLYHAANSALIEELVVHESARGRGVGSALMSELLRRLSLQGCAEVSVTTMPDNDRAIHFYRSHGLVDEAVFLEKHL